MIEGLMLLTFFLESAGLTLLLSMFLHEEDRPLRILFWWEKIYSKKVKLLPIRKSNSCNLLMAKPKSLRALDLSSSGSRLSTITIFKTRNDIHVLTKHIYG